MKLMRCLGECRSKHLQTIGDYPMTGNPKPFLRFTKSLRQSSTDVSARSTMNGTAPSAFDKADALSNQFQSVFTKEDYRNLPTLNGTPTKCMPPIQISTEGIVKLLKELIPQKAPGPDSIAPTILRTSAEHVAPLSKQIIQKSIESNDLPLDLQKASISHIFKKGNR